MYTPEGNSEFCFRSLQYLPQRCEFLKIMYFLLLHSMEHKHSMEQEDYEQAA